MYDRDADAFFQRANAYAALNENGLASEDLHSGIQLSPSNAAAICRRAVTELGLGHFPLAISLFSDALAVWAGRDEGVGRGEIIVQTIFFLFSFTFI